MDRTKLLKKAGWLDILVLDEQLVTAIEQGAARGDVRAIEIGYQRLGLMRDGEFLGLCKGSPAISPPKTPGLSLPSKTRLPLPSPKV